MILYCLFGQKTIRWLKAVVLFARTKHLEQLRIVEMQEQSVKHDFLLLPTIHYMQSLPSYPDIISSSRSFNKNSIN